MSVYAMTYTQPHVYFLYKLCFSVSIVLASDMPLLMHDFPDISICERIGVHLLSFSYSKGFSVAKF